MLLELCVGWVEALDQELLVDEDDDEEDDDGLVEPPLFAEELLLDPLASPSRTFASDGGSDEASEGDTGGGVPLNDGGGFPFMADQSPGGGVPCTAGPFACGRLLAEGGVGGGVPQSAPAVPGEAEEGEADPLARPEDDAPLVPPIPLDEPEP